jgi:peptide/nickel transport system permease protein
MKNYLQFLNVYILLKGIKLFLKVLLLFLTVLMLASMNSLIYNENILGFYPFEFFNTVKTTFENLLSLKDGLILIPHMVKTISVFNYLPKAYSYSMTVLFSALLLGVIFAFTFVYMYLWLPLKAKRLVRKIISVLETLPDVFIIMSFQFGVIYLYKKTGLKFLQIYSLNTEVYIMPIICLMLVPFFMLIRIMITLFEEEYEKLYVDFARAKGLSQLEVFTKHVVRNIIYSFSQYLSLIYWMMITSLILVEYLFLIDGFTLLLYRFVSPEIFILAVGLILLPYSLIILLIRLIGRKIGVPQHE